MKRIVLLLSTVLALTFGGAASAISLLDRLTGSAAPSLNGFLFGLGLQEYAVGAVTRGTLESQYGIAGDAEQQAELDWLQGQYAASVDSAEWLKQFQALLILAEQDIFGYANRTTLVTRIQAIP